MLVKVLWGNMGVVGDVLEVGFVEVLKFYSCVSGDDRCDLVVVFVEVIVYRFGL